MDEFEVQELTGADAPHGDGWYWITMQGEEHGPYASEQEAGDAACNWHPALE